MRVDLDRDGRVGHPRVRLRRGTIVVSRSGDAADGMLAATGVVVDDVATARANALGTTLRNGLEIQGDPSLHDRDRSPARARARKAKA